MAGNICAEKVNLISRITTNPKMLYVESDDPDPDQVPSQSITGNGYIEKIAISDLVYTRNEVDTKLSLKADTTYVNTELGKKQNTLTSANAGTGITISGNTISADTNYIGSIQKIPNQWTPYRVLLDNGTWGSPYTHVSDGVIVSVNEGGSTLRCDPNYLGRIQKNGSTTQYLRGDGTWATPGSSSSISVRNVDSPNGGTPNESRSNVEYIKDISISVSGSTITLTRICRTTGACGGC
jgi:hypothetical protein